VKRKKKSKNFLAKSEIRIGFGRAPRFARVGEALSALPVGQAQWVRLFASVPRSAELNPAHASRIKKFIIAEKYDFSIKN
jgi:hypothetical protein